MNVSRYFTFMLFFCVNATQAMELTHGHLLQPIDDQSKVASLKELCLNSIGSNVKLEKKSLKQLPAELQEELPAYALASKVLKKVPSQKNAVRRFIGKKQLIEKYSPFFIKIKSELHKILLKYYLYQAAAPAEKKIIFDSIIKECNLVEQSIQLLRDRFDGFNHGLVKYWALYPFYDEVDRTGKTAIEKLKKIKKACREFLDTVRTQNESQHELTSDELEERNSKVLNCAYFMHKYCDYLDRHLYPEFFASKKSIRCWKSTHLLLDRQFCLAHREMPRFMKEKCLRLALEAPQKADAIRELSKQLELDADFDKDALDAIVQRLPNN